MFSYPIGAWGSNALIGLAEIIFSVADPVASAGRLEKFTGRPALAAAPGISIALDRGKLTFMEPRDVPRLLGIGAGPEAPAIVAVGLVSSNFAKTRDFLRAQGIGLAADEPGRLIVGPDEALGCALVIYPAGD